MRSVCVPRTTPSRQALDGRLKTAQQQGNLRPVKDRLAILAVEDGRRFAEVAVVVPVHEKTGAAWVGRCCGAGVHGAPRRQPTGQPPKLTSTPPSLQRDRGRLG